MSPNDTKLEPGHIVFDDAEIAGEEKMVVLHVADIPAKTFYVPDIDQTVAEYNEMQHNKYGIEMYPDDDPVVATAFTVVLRNEIPNWKKLSDDELFDRVQVLNQQQPESNIIFSFPASRLRVTGHKTL